MTTNMTTSSCNENPPTLMAWCKELSDKDQGGLCYMAFGMTLALGRAWRSLTRMGVPWDVAVRAVQVTRVLPCGLPVGVDAKPDAEGLPDFARTAVRRMLVGKSAPFSKWIRKGGEEWLRRMERLSEEELAIDMGAMQHMASLIGESWRLAQAGVESFEVLLGATELSFDETGWVQGFRLNPRTTEVREVDDGLELVLKQAS